MILVTIFKNKKDEFNKYDTKDILLTNITVRQFKIILLIQLIKKMFYVNDKRKEAGKIITKNNNVHL